MTFNLGVNLIHNSSSNLSSNLNSHQTAKSFRPIPSSSQNALMNCDYKSNKPAKTHFELPSSQVRACDGEPTPPRPRSIARGFSTGRMNFTMQNCLSPYWCRRVCRVKSTPNAPSPSKRGRPRSKSPVAPLMSSADLGTGSGRRSGWEERWGKKNCIEAFVP